MGGGGVPVAHLMTGYASNFGSTGIEGRTLQLDAAKADISV